MAWTIARVKNPNLADVNPSMGIWDKYFAYVIKYNGVIVGEVKHQSRPKNAGGPAWCGRLFAGHGLPQHQSTFDHGMDKTYWRKDKKEVLEWFKTGEMKEDRIPGFMLRRAV